MHNSIKLLVINTNALNQTLCIKVLVIPNTLVFSIYHLKTNTITRENKLFHDLLALQMKTLTITLRDFPLLLSQGKDQSNSENLSR